MLRPLIATLVLTGLALANPLLDSDFWKTATPADVEKAVQKGGQVGARDKDGWTPLHWAARFNAKPQVLTTLVKLGAKVDARDKNGQTPLHAAALIKSNPKIVLTLLELGADPKAKTNGGRTPWDLIQKNEKLKYTDAYWRLNQLRY